MTNFDAIVTGGPETLAFLLTKSKIAAMEKICKEFGVAFSVSDETFEQVRKEHLDDLLAEYKG